MRINRAPNSPVLQVIFQLRIFYPYKEWKIVQNEYVELFDRGVPLIPHFFPH